MKTSRKSKMKRLTCTFGILYKILDIYPSMFQYLSQKLGSIQPSTNLRTHTSGQRKVRIDQHISQPWKRLPNFYCKRHNKLLLLLLLYTRLILLKGAHMLFLTQNTNPIYPMYNTLHLNLGRYVFMLVTRKTSVPICQDFSVTKKNIH